MVKVKPLFKGLLSLWILYNVFVMVVMPNAGGYFGRLTTRYISDYAAVVGLNAGWNFFSPDPAHTMYIRYMIYFDSDEESGEYKDPVEGFFPEEKDRYIRNLFRRRELYVMRFMVLNSKHMKYLLGPWLCRQHPGARNVDMEHVVETVPPLDQAVTRRSEDVRDLSKELQFVAERYNCAGTDEVEL